MEEKKVMIYKWLKEESAKHFDWVDTIFFVRDSIYSDKKKFIIFANKNGESISKELILEDGYNYQGGFNYGKYYFNVGTSQSDKDLCKRRNSTYTEMKIRKDLLNKSC